MIRTKGYIRNLKVDKKEKYTLVKFDLSETKEGSLGKHFSGFNFEGLKEGQFIEFEYEVKGEYNNIKSLCGVDLTHERPDKKDILSVNPLDNLLVEYIRLYNTAIQICYKNNTISDGEIKSQFTRLVSLLELDNVFSEVKEYLKEKYEK